GREASKALRGKRIAGGPAAAAPGGAGRGARGRARFRRFARRSTRRVRILSPRTCPTWSGSGSTRSATARRSARLLSPCFRVWTSGIDFIRAGTDLFRRDGRHFHEIRRTLLEEGCECLLGFCGAHSLTELLHFGSDQKLAAKPGGAGLSSTRSERPQQPKPRTC